MIRVLLDTNVLASAVLDRRSTPGSLLLLWTYDYFQLLISEEVIDELTRTLGKPYFRRRLPSETLSATIDLLRREATLTPVVVEIQSVASHPEDDVILAAAVSGHADYLVTGDAMLLRIGTYEGVAIVSPRELLEILHRGDR